MKHPIEIAKEKFAKNKDITVCQVVARGKTNICGVVYKGLFYPDCYFDDKEGQVAYVIEDGEGICLFTSDGTFATRYKLDFGIKEKVKK
ncbi:hypothetical protein [Sulfurospirillum cavolei]|uniref:hypothetical protein n=1 Tax=Sulfurospirillum cavolei TaxID=366522 RepID=UPI0007649199|nr:hypothetical protein [Sulfurospirillum cavolei]